MTNERRPGVGTETANERAGDLGSMVPLGSDNPAGLAERFLIGSMLHLRGDVARRAVASVQATDLASAPLRAALEAMRSLAAEDRDPDPAAVAERLLTLGLVSRDRTGIVNALLVDLLTEVPAPTAWPHYRSLVLREAARRVVREHATRAVQAADTDSLTTALRVLSDGLTAAALAVSRVIDADRGQA